MAATKSTPEPDALGEMLRQAERVVDDQVKTFERADLKSERLVALGLAVLGGMVGVTLQLGEAAGQLKDPWFWGIVTIGAGLSAWAIRDFLAASLGMLRRSELRIGPSPGWLRLGDDAKPVTIAEVRITALEALDHAYLENLAKLNEAFELRVAGARHLSAAVAVFAFGMVFILGR